MRGSQNNARQYALKLLSYRARSERELTERLTKRGIPPTAVSSVIQDLKELGLVDDMALAQVLKRQALTTKLMSRSAARRYVLARGVPREIVDLVFAQAEDTDLDNAERLVDKKLRILRNYPVKILERRLYGLLYRRGYSSGTIMKVLKNRKLKEED